ncbi:hypothetical protein PTKIN_Ptkin06aG0164500 [Pterospermum kingtungense]
MEEGLRRAAQSGNIDSLYALIQDGADVLRHIDQMEFVDTPLHVAAAAGHTDFAMEIINLKPSFARKLNQMGFSPIHLALQNGQTEMAVDLLSVDKDLVRVKGREGYTPLHYVATGGNVPLLSQFLDLCPYSVLDLTVRKETALHIAAKNNRLEAFETILRMIKMTPEDDDQFQRKIILNLQDKDGNSVLHIAASNNQPQMIQLLTKCKEVDKSKVNKSGFTALVILQRQALVDSRESVKILNRGPSRFSTLPGAGLADYAKKMKPETINALLVVLNLVLTMTYQAILSPPGSVSQGNDASGTSVLPPVGFLFFYIPNWAAFLMAFFITLTLFDVVANSIAHFLYPLYWVMCFCYGVGTVILAPSSDIAVGAIVPGTLLTIFVYLCAKRK